ncbi:MULTISPECIES: GLUG motif-containing protein [unclassified Beijerinckia]|uniref:two-partner secretion domain-containing protein n=1 Tax=unclassified Beijerinckia TaxID=2638183 RepID=UPI0008944B8C|nr:MULTISPECIES: GLUG motif-containing protein [unclassified Beijerinckia]MDH7796022.1 filamentous hemagglutinin family protein [Beijerinckia sp. GAS462]SEC26811.1 filamentous hemagglutinin family N-terminal domain-containing protein [Beijerinckia sp. 28-YEA-48]
MAQSRGLRAACVLNQSKGAVVQPPLSFSPQGLAIKTSAAKYSPAGSQARFFYPGRGYDLFVTMTAMAALLVLSLPVLAEPRGGTVVDGAAAISQVGAATNINQSSNRAIINWQGFSVGANETVNFYQPGASSVTLNRVIGNEASVINGAINANGQVFIVNSAGVLFGGGSQINVGGLVASTLDISNQDFMAGNYTFSGTSNASVINQGRIRAHSGGYVALLGKTVSNEGVISARLGTVAMAAGEKMTLNFGGNSLLDVTIDKGTLNALVENKRAIRANGGQVIMTAKAADQLLSAQVNNTGIVQARTVGALRGGTTSSGNVRVGKIKILAEGGRVNISGRLDASAPRGGNGGFIETSGAKVKIADGAVITTKAAAGRSGTWLIDPTDFNIVAGSGALTGSGIGAATLANNLANGNVMIATVAGGTENGDINVNAAVSWQADTILTLNAHNNININEAITATGNAAGLTLNAGNNININNAVSFSGANATLVMNYGGYNGTSVLTPAAGTDCNIRTRASYSGTVLDDNGIPVAKQDTSGGVYGSITFSNSANANGLTINGQAYTLIHSMAQLPAISGVSGYFALAQDLNSSGTYTAAVITSLDGTFTGLGHTISNLTIAEPLPAPVIPIPTGLIGTVQSGSVIRDIGLLNVNVTAYSRVGGLVGENLGGAINGAYVTGSVSGAITVGGLVGFNGSDLTGRGGVISSSYSAAAVSGSANYDAFQYIGGLVGWNTGANSKITASHATGSVAWPGASPTSNTDIGGLAGRNLNGTIANSYATGNITVNDGAGNVGGLVGFGGGATGIISYSFATGNVTGGLMNVGGLMGQNLAGGRITGSYATGNITAGKNDSVSQNFGGLVGLNSGGASTITDSFANGNVTVNGGNYAGGLVGNNSGTISGSTANGNVNGSPISDAMGGLVGNNSGTITGSRSNGDVTGQTAGGLVGSNSGTINNSTANGSVNSRTGGGQDIAHTNTGTVTNSTYRDVKAEQRAEAERLEAERIEAARVEAARVEAARVEAARIEAARLEAARVETARVEAAARAAFQSEAARTGSTVANTDPSLSSAAPPATAAPIKATRDAADNEAVDAGFKQVEQQASSEDERRENERKAAAARAAAAAAAAHRASVQRANANRAGGGSGGGYGATIRSIDVDGQRFNLEGGGGSNNSGAPASGGAQ